MSRGLDRERQVRRRYEQDGYVVVRAAGSLGPVDLVALKRGSRPIFVEVKSTAGGPFEHFGPADRARMTDAGAQAGADCVLCWWPPRRQPQWVMSYDWPAVKAAA